MDENRCVLCFAIVIWAMMTMFGAIRIGRIVAMIDEALSDPPVSPPFTSDICSRRAYSLRISKGSEMHSLFIFGSALLMVRDDGKVSLW